MELLKPVFTVHELNEYVDLMLGHDPNLKSLTVEGELSGCKRHTSGHLYFSLKDDTASVSCVMWKQSVLSLRFIPRDGMKVRLTGSASLYARDGRFQVYARTMSKQGEGDLYAAFCRYRDELKALGWFEQDLKKQIPKLPVCVGVVTSSSGAALQDIKNVIGRRFPTMPIRLYPAAVQGETAAKEIAAAIKRADADHVCDVLIVGRGGGSMEDLWAFNESPVAEAVHDCSIPVISAVGHETDFSICDFVADMRAPTPSAAAELAVPEKRELDSRLSEAGKRLALSIRNGIRKKRDRLDLLWSDGVSVKAQLRINKTRQKLEDDWDTIDQTGKEIMKQEKDLLTHLHEKLKAYSPQKTLQRGFSLLYNDRNQLIMSYNEVNPGDRISVRVADGRIGATVTERQGESV